MPESPDSWIDTISDSTSHLSSLGAGKAQTVCSMHFRSRAKVAVPAHSCAIAADSKRQIGKDHRPG